MRTRLVAHSLSDPPGTCVRSIRHELRQPRAAGRSPTVPDAQLPSESERRAFVAKLAEFRNTLRNVEQEMLDSLVGAAVTGRAPQDLTHFWIGPRLDPAEPVDEGEPTVH